MRTRGARRTGNKEWHMASEGSHSWRGPLGRRGHLRRLDASGEVTEEGKGDADRAGLEKTVWGREKSLIATRQARIHPGSAACWPNWPAAGPELDQLLRVVR